MLEAINTVATIATLVVLTAAAIAAAIQLHHMRTSNQLQAFIDIFDRAQSPEMQELFDMVYSLPESVPNDPEYLSKIARGTTSLHHSPLLLAFWFDEVGIALRQRLVQPFVFFQVGPSADNTIRAWVALRPLIEAVRTRAPAAFLHFEYAAVNAKRWLDAHPKGDYPRGVPRWSDIAS